MPIYEIISSFTLITVSLPHCPPSHFTSCTDTDFYSTGKGTPYYLRIKEQSLRLCCTEIQGQPTLQLKEENIMNLYGNVKGQEPFLFFRSKEGSAFVFQSVSCPGWFIERGKTESTDFYLEDVKTKSSLGSRWLDQAVRDSSV
uniref:Interleukin-1 n=1 Tax=Balaenoptera musculus TaxID=9771 RepID=A0A8C0DJA2_BALMU